MMRMVNSIVGVSVGFSTPAKKLIKNLSQVQWAYDIPFSFGVNLSKLVTFLNVCVFRCRKFQMCICRKNETVGVTTGFLIST